MFCVECGKETDETFNGLCIECYVKINKFFDIPSSIVVTICKNCSSYKIDKEWMQGGLESLIKKFLERSTKHDEIKNFRVNIEKNKVTCSGNFHGFFIREDGQINIKIKNSICEVCSRMKGGYFEAILQVRKENMEMTESEIKLSDEIVYGKASAYGGAYISKRERKHGGVDYYMGDKKIAASAARILNDAFRGETNISSSLIGVKDGREVYRNTYIVRIPEYSKNGYVEINDRVYRVFDMGKRIGLRDMASGEKKYFYRNEMSKAKVMDVDELEAIVLSKKENEIQILDPENYRTVVISKPKEIETGEKVKIIKWKGRIYLVGD